MGDCLVLLFSCVNKKQQNSIHNEHFVLDMTDNTTSTIIYLKKDEQKTDNGSTDETLFL